MATTFNNITAAHLIGGNVFIDGKRFSELKSIEMPKLAFKTFSTNTTIGEYEVVSPLLEAMSVSMTLNNISSTYFSLIDFNGAHSFYIKQNKHNMNGDEAIVATFEGNVKNFELPGGDINSEVELTIEMALTKIQYEINGSEVFFADFENGVERANGTDLTASIRANLF